MTDKHKQTEKLEKFLLGMKKDEKMATPAYNKGAKLADSVGRPGVAKMLRSHGKDEKRHFHEIKRVKIKE
jgi:rubrerythrin